MMKSLRYESFGAMSGAIKPSFRIAAIILMTLMVAGPSRAEDFVPLSGNHAPAAKDLTANGTTAPPYQSLQMEIYLKPRNQAELQQLLNAQQDPASPEYHKWLTPGEYAQEFGPAASDVAQVSQWLASQGFAITYASASEGRIAFNGNVGLAQDAFSVNIAASSDGKRYGNLDDPQIPASLAPKISYLSGLDNLHGTRWNAVIDDPPYNNDGLTGKYFGPNDIRTFNDETPLLTAGYDGAGQCIAVSEGSDVDQASLSEFNTIFNLPAFVTGTNFVSVFPDGSPDPPGSDNGGSAYDEAMVDVEYAHGVAPGAAIVLYAANSANGASDPLVDTVIAAANDKTNNCATLAISWAQCGQPASFYTALDQTFSQAATEGKSIFVATGDVGTAEPEFNPETGSCAPDKIKGIEEIAGSSNVTAVGATMFPPVYDSNGDDTSTLTDTTQSVWKFSIVSKQFPIFAGAGASTGGYSKIFPLPAWQKGVAGISGKFRAVPDLVLGGGDLGGSENITVSKDKVKVTGSVFPAPDFWVCLDSGYAASEASAGYECTVGGGTSFVPPQYSGLFAIVAQKTGKQQGLINPTLYAMAKANLKNLSATGIVDITTGNNAYAPVSGYSAKKGYDLASGWGAVDMTNFVNSFIGFVPPTTK